jgi:hypothetical protein
MCSPSASSENWGASGRVAGLICERLKILRDGCEDELVMGAGQAPQSHALKAMLNLQMGKAHLYFLALHRLIAQTQGCPLAIGHSRALLR